MWTSEVMARFLCPACAQLNFITFKEPRPFMPTVAREQCPHCDLRFEVKVSTSKILFNPDLHFQVIKMEGGKDERQRKSPGAL
jgi:hypothetical protein